MRIITNPPVRLVNPSFAYPVDSWRGQAALREPFNFNRDDPKEFSLVELKTLKALGVDRLGFTPTTERRRLAPRSLEAKNAMLEEEKKRLAAWGSAQSLLTSVA